MTEKKKVRFNDEDDTDNVINEEKSCNIPITPIINEYNVNNIQKMICRKMTSSPYYANGESVKGSLTDMDHFPYTRFFRGVSYFPSPVVMEREAGWRPVNNQCYKNQLLPPIKTSSQNCYSSACSTIFPCMKSGKRECVITYR